MMLKLLAVGAKWLSASQQLERFLVVLLRCALVGPEIVGVNVSNSFFYTWIIVEEHAYCKVEIATYTA